MKSNNDRFSFRKSESLIFRIERLAERCAGIDDGIQFTCVDRLGLETCGKNDLGELFLKIANELTILADENPSF